jgi:hypothetical protein
MFQRVMGISKVRTVISPKYKVCDPNETDWAQGYSLFGYILKHIVRKLLQKYKYFWGVCVLQKYELFPPLYCVCDPKVTGSG